MINDIIGKEKDKINPKNDEVLILPAHNERKINHTPQIRKQYKSYDQSLQRKIVSEE